MTVTDNGTAHLAELQQLRSLALGSQGKKGLSAATAESIAQLPQLEALVLNCGVLDDAVCTAVASMPKVEQVRLMLSGDLTDSHLHELSSSKSLRVLCGCDDPKTDSCRLRSPPRGGPPPGLTQYRFFELIPAV